MVDLKNKTLYKIMWLPGEGSIIWDMKNESQVVSDLKIHQYINLEKWKADYEELYGKWLKYDDTGIYDLSHEVNRRILGAIKKANNEEGNLDNLVFYWFDQDRTYEDETDAFVWTENPISGDKLLDLGASYHYLNRLVSLEDFIVFPKYHSDQTDKKG